MAPPPRRFVWTWTNYDVYHTLTGGGATRCALTRCIGDDTGGVLRMFYVSRQPGAAGYDVHAVKALMPAPAAFTVFLVCVVRRRSLPAHDSHKSGPHLMVVWADPASRTMRRFDPYYYDGDADCARMQAALDAALTSRLPDGWTLDTADGVALRAAFPFGPEFVESTSKLPRAVDEEYCAVWAMAFARALADVHEETAPRRRHPTASVVRSMPTGAHALHKMHADLELEAPRTRAEVRARADAFLQAMRRVCHDVPRSYRMPIPAAAACSPLAAAEATSP